MQEQKKFRYIFNGKEVSKEEFEKLSGGSFKWFDGDSIVSVPFSSFDSFFNGEYRSDRQVNDHVKEVLSSKVKSEKFKNLEQDILKNQEICNKYFLDSTYKKLQEKNTNSTRHKSQAGETHKENFLVDSTPLGITDIKRAVAIELEKDDVITSSNRGEKETIEHLQGVKESEGKLNYELDWDFIQQMAERMGQNKGKYKPYNWTKPMDVEKLKQSLFRHVIEVMKSNYSDDGRDFGHFESIALNAMMINYQLKTNG